MLQVRAVQWHGDGGRFHHGRVIPTATQRTVITYAYDPLYRLTKADSTGALTTTFEYTYDPVATARHRPRRSEYTSHNHINTTRPTGISGQRSADTWMTMNLLSDGAKTYTYNQANQLTNISGAGFTWSCTSYNGEGARLKQAANGAVTTYTLDLARRWCKC